MTQEPLVKRLKKGWLSSAQWYEEHKSLKLTSRMTTIRRHPVLGKRLKQREVRRNGKTFCEYRLA